MNHYMSISCKVLNTYTTNFAMYLNFVTYFSLHLYVSTCNNVDQRSFSSDRFLFFLPMLKSLVSFKHTLCNHSI